MANNPTLRVLVGLFKLIRLPYCSLAVTYTLIGAYLSGGIKALLSIYVLGAIAVVSLVVSFGFAINDYRDVLTDSLIKPNRPIPAGLLSRKSVGITAITLVLIAFGIALTLTPLLIAVSIINICLSLLYSFYLKSTVIVGNAIIALLNASIIIYGSLATGKLIPVTWLAGILIFLLVLAQEILFTVRDRDGDAHAGICTIATSMGASTAVRLFQLIALLFILLTISAFVLRWASNLFFYTMIPISILPLFTLIAFLNFGITRDTIRISQVVLRCIGVFGIIPIILLR